MEEELKELELQLKRLEVRERTERLRQKRFSISPFVIGIVTVVLSVIGSYITVSLQVKNQNQNFSTELIEGILNDEVVVSNRKVKFLNEAGLLNVNKDSILQAMSRLSELSAPLYYTKGYTFLHSNQYVESLNYLKSAVELNPSYSDAYSLLAYNYYLLGKQYRSTKYYVLGKEAILKSLELDNTDLHSHYWHGRINLALHNYPSAKEIFQKVISHKVEGYPEYFVESTFFLGETLRLMKEPQYCSYYERAREMGSKNADSHLNRYCKRRL